jgi:hypothetical protein
MKIMKEVIADPTSHSVEEWRRATKVYFYCVRGAVGVMLDEYDDKSFEADGQPEANVTPQEARIIEVYNRLSPDSRTYLRSLRGSVIEITGHCMKEIIVDMDKPSDEYKRDPKGLKHLIITSNLLLVFRTKKNITPLTFRRGKSQVSSLKALFGDVVVHTRYKFELLHQLKTGGLKERPAFLDGSEQGKSVDAFFLKYRYGLVCTHFALQASFDIPQRLKLGRARGNAVDERVLVGYESLVDGILGLSSHPYYKVMTNACGVFNNIACHFGFLVQDRYPRLLSLLDLSDGDDRFRTKSYGIPITADLPSDEKGNARLGEIVISVLVNLGSGLKNIINNKTVFYEGIRKYVMSEVLIVRRLEPRQQQKTLGLLNEVLNALRSNWWFDHRYASAEEKKEHLYTIKFLIDLLVSGPRGAEEGSFNWRNKLTVCWFIMQLMGSEEAKNQELMLELAGICIGMIEVELAGQPIQRLAMGLLGRLMSLDEVRLEDGSCDGSSAFRSAVAAKLSDATFCDAVVNSLALAALPHGDWSLGVGPIINDAFANCAGGSAYPSLRENLSSRVFKVRHARVVENLLNCITDADARKVSAGYFLDSAKILAASPPSEDQKMQHTSSAEVFAGICHSLLSLPADADAWGLMLPALEYMLNIVFIDAIADWSDGLRFGIHQRGLAGLKPVLFFIKDKVQSTLWRPTQFDVEGIGEEGFASQTKWLTLLQPLLVELFSIDPRMTLLECICGAPPNGAVVDATDVAADGLKSMSLAADAEELEAERQMCSSTQYVVSEEQVALITEVTATLLPRLLEAISHPFQKCRSHISLVLHTLSGATTAHKALNIPTAQFQEAMISAFLEQLKPSVLLKKKNHARNVLASMLHAIMHHGDVHSYYRKLIVPLMESLFYSLETDKEEAEETADASESTGHLEAESTSNSRVCILILATRCMLCYDGAEKEIEDTVRIVGDCGRSSDWRVRQAACVFLGRFFGVHKFLLKDVQSEQIFDLMTALMGDEKREVSSSATAGLTGCLAVMTDGEVQVLVEKMCKQANKSAPKRKKKKAISPDAAAVAAVDVDSAAAAAAEMEKAEKEEKRQKSQRISISILCAALNRYPYDVPKFAPPAIEALASHSTESAAPLGIRELVKKTLKDFKRTHVDRWDVYRLQFTEDQLDALSDVTNAEYYV